jgi:hypothetical protein
MDNSGLLRLDFKGWPLPDEYLVELGRVSALWSSLESLLMVSLAKLAGFNEPENPAPFIFTAHANFPQRLDMLGSFCEQLASQHSNLKDYASVLAKLRAAQKSRNRYLHNGITIDKSTGRAEIGLGSARGKVKVAIEAVELGDIRRAALDVHEAQRALLKLVFLTESPSKFGE